MPKLRPRFSRKNSLNRKIYDSVLRRAHVLAELEESLLGELLEEIEEHYSEDFFRLRRAGRRAHARRIAKALVAKLKRRMLTVYLHGRMSLTFLRQEFEPLGLVFRESAEQAIVFQVDADDVARKVAKGLKRNIPLQKLRQTWGDSLFKSVEKHVTSGMQQGLLPEQMLRKVKDALPDKRNFRAGVRTMVAAANNQALQDSYKANAHLLNGQQYVATLDDRTCPTCGQFDGKVYYYEPADATQESVNSKPGLPQHLNCRCTYVAVTKSWPQFIQDGTAPQGLKPEQTKKLEGWFNGKPEKRLSYDQWLKSQPAAVITKVLGKSQAQAFSKGVVLQKLAPSGKVISDAAAEKLATAVDVTAAPVAPVPSKAKLKVDKLDALKKKLAIEKAKTAAKQAALKAKQAEVAAAKVQAEKAKADLAIIAKAKAKQAKVTAAKHLPKQEYLSLHKQWQAKLTPRERSGIKGWTHQHDVDFQVIQGRKTIWGEAANPPSALSKKLYKEYQAALDKAPPFTGKTHRGIAVPTDDLPAFLERWKKGGLVETEFDMATSLSPGVAKTFANNAAAKLRGKIPGEASKVRLVVKQKGVSGVHIEDLSRYRREQEVVLRKGAKMKVAKHTKAADGTTVIHLEELTASEAAAIVTEESVKRELAKL